MQKKRNGKRTRRINSDRREHDKNQPTWNSGWDDFIVPLPGDQSHRFSPSKCSDDSCLECRCDVIGCAKGALHSVHSEFWNSMFGNDEQ